MALAVFRRPHLSLPLHSRSFSLPMIIGECNMVQTHWLMSFPSLSLAAFYKMFETLGESPSMVSQECTALVSIAVLESANMPWYVTFTIVLERKLKRFRALQRSQGPPKFSNSIPQFACDCLAPSCSWKRSLHPKFNHFSYSTTWPQAVKSKRHRTCLQRSFQHSMS